MLLLDRSAREKLPGLWASALRVRRDDGLAPRTLPEPITLFDATWTSENVKDNEVAAGFRKVSWSVGIDPTKNRPAGEALARRVLRGKALPAILPLVDAYNLASASTLTPLGAYDLAATPTPITIRAAGGDEAFHGIGREPEKLDEGRIIHESRDGIVCGVMLWRDGVRSCVREGTREALVMAVGADPLGRAVGDVALAAAWEMLRLIGFDAVGGVVQAVDA